MKKLLLISVTLLCSLFSVLAQEQADTGISAIKDTSAVEGDELKEVLQATIQQFDSSKNYVEMQSVSNKLGLIAKKWNYLWIAQYYPAYALSVLSYIEKSGDKRDAYLDEAEQYLNNAISLNKGKNDELHVMAAMIANARLAVKPGSRYKKFGEIFNAQIDSAKSLNPNNPRIYYLQGTSIYYTPKMFGGGPKNSLPLFEKADALYQNEKGGDVYKPFWGKQQNDELLKKCMEEVK